ncbi:MAG: hypothetical protein GX267_15765 [Fibrobacter sp.]|jgi:apolipoprotein D and lipocalin family protein|nr:hypothetical protein [Fibrobacter sp.]
MRKSHLIVSVLLVFLTVTILPARPTKIETVKNIDLDRYTGTWYEIARMPNKHEKGLVEVTSTLKKVGKNKYMLISSGYKGSRGGKRSTLKGAVEIPDKNNTGNLKLKVFLFTVDFQIIDIDQENYNYALVTSDEGKNLWIFSRSPVMDPRDYKKMMDSARDKGFEVASLEKVSQTSNSAYAER